MTSFFGELFTASSLVQGGKRLRPVLTLLTARATGASEAGAVGLRRGEVIRKDGRSDQTYVGMAPNSSFLYIFRVFNLLSRSRFGAL